MLLIINDSFSKFFDHLFDVCYYCRQASSLDTKRVDLFDGPGQEGYGEENVLLASSKLQAYFMSLS